MKVENVVQDVARDGGKIVLSRCFLSYMGKTAWCMQLQ